ncbi:MAG: YggS family pyridoxal phosphate-dependent enzyme [Gammaproteobacteria bacterium]|nr:YggS family pyridoxal phosphate-dependent enzyme [Gammaproteobacteria bacterium]MDP2141070.1 YggS family pyridoxal phosphate-dependent enzyme [Gammaproteobacteria bacterium]MDP2348528.1 YggS family pyridoxal phosphate-dependent enzyme [Gammaproteobacteria bacterium]
MASIAENISTVRKQITKCAEQSGRAADSVCLLAVSKTQSPELIREAYAAGQHDFGENYVQEALDKITTLPLPGIRWHFIGPIQSNKTRDIAEHFDWVHSVDRLKIAQRLDAQRPATKGPLNICIQINLSAEDTKSGTSLEEAEGLCTQISKLQHLRLRGLMAIPAPCADLDQQRQVFRPLAEMLGRLAIHYPQMDTLSIGMSADFEAAIAEGSTIVRIGTAIFGARPH